MPSRKLHCRHAHHAGYMTHRCPAWDGLTICCQCAEMIECRCVGRKRLRKAAIVASERLAGRKRTWIEKVLGRPAKR